MTKESPDSAEYSELAKLLMGEHASRLSREMEELRAAQEAQNRAIAGMRLDRQLRRLPRGGYQAVKRRMLAQGRRIRRSRAEVASGVTGTARPNVRRSGLLILAHGYPVEERSYGGQPLARRVPFYKAAGHDVTILIPSTDDTRKNFADRHGARIIQAPITSFGALAAEASPAQLAVHSPTPELWAAAGSLKDEVPTHVWFHGYESRDWRLLSFDFSADEIERLGPRLDAVNVERQKTLVELFADRSTTKIFVSEHMKGLAESFAGCSASNAHVIHNVIDPGAFPYVEKSADARMTIAVIRSFAKRNYGTDLMSLAVRELARQPWFDEISIRIIGDGKHHEEDTRPLRDYPNVFIEQGFVGPNEIGSILASSGIALIPTRWDSQGMMMGEAMAAGLVPVTNAVTAIPEFVDEKTAMLAGPDDYEGLAAGIARLVESPDLFLEMSAAAHERVLRQCGPDATVARELELFDEAAR